MFFIIFPWFFPSFPFWPSLGFCCATSPFGVQLDEGRAPEADPSIFQVPGEAAGPQQTQWFQVASK